jgi:hypothetical protein
VLGDVGLAEDTMREAFLEHFDVVIVMWVLALAVGWSIFALSHAQLSQDQWSQVPQNGPAWVILDDAS